MKKIVAVPVDSPEADFVILEDRAEAERFIASEGAQNISANWQLRSAVTISFAVDDEEVADQVVNDPAFASLSVIYQIKELRSRLGTGLMEAKRLIEGARRRAGL